MRPIRLAAIGLALALTLGCDEGPTSPTIQSMSSGGSSATVNLAGSWSGTATDTAGTFRMSWQLSQSGPNVTGTVIGTTPVGAPLYANGTFTGALSGNVLTFTIAIPRGGVSDAPDCSITFSGTAQDVTNTGITGMYTGNDSCLGAILDGRLTMLKQ